MLPRARVARRFATGLLRVVAGIVLLASSFVGPTLGAPTPAGAQSANCGAPAPGLVNGGFELPAVGANSAPILDTDDPANASLVWRNTAEDNVEMWHQFIEGVPAYEGSQFVELNAYLAGTLYQDLVTLPGQAMTFSFAHKARVLDGETVIVLAGPPGGPLTEIGRYAANVTGPDRNGWTLHGGSYQVPAGQGLTRFAFRSDGSTTVDPTTGNFIDAVEFTLRAGACDDVGTIGSGSSLASSVLANDLGAGLRVTGVGSPTPAGAGTASVVADEVRYDVTAGFSGAATIPYTVVDGSGATSSAELVVQVYPIATGDLFNADEDTPVTLDVLANDLGTDRTIVSVADPTHGTASITPDGRIAYVPDPGEVGIDTFRYTLGADGDGAAPAGSLSVAVTVNVAPRADLALSQLPAIPTTIRRGETFSYPLTVGNLGPSTAVNPAVTFALPAGFSLVAGGDCEPGPPATCRFPAALGAGLDPGESFTFNPRLVADVEGPSFAIAATAGSATVDRNPSNDTVTQTVAIQPAADLSVGPGAVPGGAVPGNAITWTVPVSNDGPSAAPGTTVELTYPAGDIGGVTVSADGSPLTCSAATPGLLDCPLGARAAGTTVTLLASGVLDPGAASASVVFTASVGSAVDDLDPTDDTAIWAALAAPSADLTVTGDPVGPTPLDPGGAATFAFDVANTGPSVASGTFLVLGVPVGLTIDGAPGGCTIAAATVVCGIGDVGSGATLGPFLFSGVVDPAVAGDVDLTASVTSAADDPDPTDDTVTVTAPVDRRADVRVLVGTSPDPAGAGGPVRVRARVVNDGPSVATGISVAIDLPADVVGSTVRVPPGCSLGGTVVTCTVGRIGPGGSASLRIEGDWAPTAVGTRTVTITRTASSPGDPVAGNDMDTSSVTVVPVADLGLAGTVSPRPLTPGGSARVRLDVTNSGPSPASGAEVTIGLPPGVTPGLLPPACSAGPGGTVTCLTGPLAAGVTERLTVPVDLVPSFTGPATFPVTVAPPVGTTDPDPTDDTLRLDDDLFPTVDLAVRAAATPVEAVAGLTGAASFVVENLGPSDAPDAPVRLTLPEGFGLRGVTGARCAPTGAPTVVECSAGALAVGTSTVLTATVAVPPGATATATVTAAVRTGFGELPVLDDAEPTNDEADVLLNPVRTADLSILGGGPPMPVPDGLAWGVAVTNSGPSVASAHRVTFGLPPGWRATGWTDPSCTVSGSTVSCPVGELAPGASALVGLTTAGPLMTAAGLTAAVDGPDYDPDPTDNQAVLVAAGQPAPTPASSAAAGGAATDSTGATASSPSGSMARTGVESGTLVLLGLGLLVAGAGTLRLRSRRGS